MLRKIMTMVLIGGGLADRRLQHRPRRRET